MISHLKTIRTFIATLTVLATCSFASSAGAQVEAVRYSEHDLISQIRLSAAYLFKPDAAENVNVVWKYSLDDYAKDAIAGLEPAGLFVKAPSWDGYVVVDASEFTGLSLSSLPYLDALKVAALDMHLEVGITGAIPEAANTKAVGGLVSRHPVANAIAGDHPEAAVIAALFANAAANFESEVNTPRSQ